MFRYLHKKKRSQINSKGRGMIHRRHLTSHLYQNINRRWRFLLVEVNESFFSTVWAIFDIIYLPICHKYSKYYMHAIWYKYSQNVSFILSTHGNSKIDLQFFQHPILNHSLEWMSSIDCLFLKYNYRDIITIANVIH